MRAAASSSRSQLMTFFSPYKIKGKPEVEKQLEAHLKNIMTGFE